MSDVYVCEQTLHAVPRQARRGKHVVAENTSGVVERFEFHRIRAPVADLVHGGEKVLPGHQTFAQQWEYEGITITAGQANGNPAARRK